MVEKELSDSLIEIALRGELDDQSYREDLLVQADSNIFAACVLGDQGALARLIGSNQVLPNSSGGPRNWQPLLYVCFSKEIEDEDAADCAQLLLEHGADPDAHFYEPAYPDAPQSALYGAVGVNCNPLLADVLLRHGANTQDGESIYHAAQHGHLECLEVLKRHGADFSAAQQPWGNTPLYFLFGHRPTDKQWPVALTGIRWLLEEGGADPNVTSTEYEETPLHSAARRHRGEALELLLAHGAHGDAPTRDGLTPYALAARHGNTEAMDALRKHNAVLPLTPVDQLLASCAVGDELHARGIISGDPDILQRLGPRDLALLCEHASEGNLQAITAMCEIGVPLDVFGEQQSTALHQSAWHGRADVAKVLVEHGAALDIKDGAYHGTPLDWACHGSVFCKQDEPGDHVAVAQTLIAAGAPLPEEDWGSEEIKALLRSARTR